MTVIRDADDRGLLHVACSATPMRRRGGWGSRVDAAAILASAVVITVLYLVAYRHHPAHPHIGGGSGWSTWFDQERYLNAARAWSQGDLDPTRHWYPPGYPLLAALFVRLLSVHAFLPLDLLCLLASFWLFSRLAGRLAAAVPHASALGAALFAAVTAVSPLGLAIWVVPWSSTGAVPLVYACLLAALRFIGDPRRPRFAFLTGLAGGLVVAFRPTDIMPLFLACSIGMTATVLRSRPGWKQAIVGAGAGVAGVALAFGVVAAVYLPIYGFHESDYIVSSGMIGFDWGLVPLRWVTLMLDPRPLLSSGQGLIEAFPWMVAGLAGFAVYLILPPRGTDRLAHATVILAATLHILVYLAYRDLHSGGLFRFANYHYFKWAYPVLALYAALLAHALLTATGRRLPMLGVTLVSAGLLLPWRAELRVTGAAPDAEVASDGHSIAFDSGLASVRDGLLVAASGDWGTIYFGPHDLTVAGHAYGSIADYKLLPRAGGFLMTPLRPLATGPARLTLRSGILADPSLAPLHVHQEIVFGLPCWLPETWHACAPEDLIPPPRFPASGTLDFDGSEAPYLTGDWANSEIHGRWTDGRSAGLRLRLAMVAPAVKPVFALDIQGSAYVPAGAGPLDVRILANGREVLARLLPNGETVSLAATLSADMLATAPPPGITTLTIRVANPRRPKDYDSTSSDTRGLGLFVRRISLTPLPPPG